MYNEISVIVEICIGCHENLTAQYGGWKCQTPTFWVFYGFMAQSYQPPWSVILEEMAVERLLKIFFSQIKNKTKPKSMKCYKPMLTQHTQVNK